MNSKAKFEAPYLRNNAVNKKSPRGISGEMLFEQHILISWKNIKNPLATKLESDCLCLFINFAIYAFWLAESQNVNKCSDWSTTKFSLVELLYFVKYGILTEYLTLFWFAMLVDEYKLNVSIQKSLKDAKFGQGLYLRVPLCYEQNWCAEQTLQHLLDLHANRQIECFYERTFIVSCKRR